MPEPSPSNYRWQVVAMLWCICFFNYADRQAIFAIFPVLEKSLHFTKEQQGLIGAAFMWVYALTAPFAGQVGDRGSRKKVILGGLVIWSIVTGFTSLCSRVWQFVLVRGAEGLGETFYFPASMSLISDYHAKETRSRAMSLHQTSVYAGTIGGSTFAGWMAEKHGWQYSFLILGGLGVLLAFVLGRFLKEPERNAAERALEENIPPAQPIPVSQFLLYLLKTPSALLIMLAFFGANSVAMIFLTWMPSALKEQFHLNLAWSGFGATFFVQSASLVGATIGGIWADRWCKSRPGAGRMLVQGVGALLGVPCIFWCGQTHELTLLLVALTCFGLAKGLYDANIWASLYEVVPVARRSTAVGVMNMVGWLGGGLATWGIGRVAASGVPLQSAIGGTAVLYLFVAILLFAVGFYFAPRDIQRREQEI